MPEKRADKDLSVTIAAMIVLPLDEWTPHFRDTHVLTLKLAKTPMDESKRSGIDFVFETLIRALRSHPIPLSTTEVCSIAYWIKICRDLGLEIDVSAVTKVPWDGQMTTVDEVLLQAIRLIYKVPVDELK